MAFEKDLIAVVSDVALFQVVHTLLEERRPSLHIREVQYEIRNDPLHDASPVQNAAEFLRGYLRTHHRALVMRDLAGSGWEPRGARELENALTGVLVANGWTPDRVAAIVIEPEVEAWLRLGSLHVRSLAQQRARRNLDSAVQAFAEQARRVVERTGGESRGKPAQPKEAFEGLLEHFGIPRSSALYRELAKRESLEGCRVPSFLRFVDTLRGWFPANP